MVDDEPPSSCAAFVSGLSGIGKRHIGYFLAQWIFCEGVGFSKAESSSEDEGDSLFGGGLFGDAPSVENPNTSQGISQKNSAKNF